VTLPKAGVREMQGEQEGQEGQEGQEVQGMQGMQGRQVVQEKLKFKKA
jgi:hypothetical protein